MATELTADQVREILKPYAMLYLGKLCEEYVATAEHAFMGVFRPQMGDEGDSGQWLRHMDLEMQEIGQVIRDIQRVESQAGKIDKEPKQ